MMTPTQQIASLVILAALAIVLGPLISIWAINALFGLQIEYSLTNWFISGLLFK